MTIDSAPSPSALSAPSRPSAPSRAGFVHRLIRKPLALISATYLIAITVACVFAGLIAPYGAQDQDLSHVLAGPSGAHLLGTDSLGRDVLSRLLYGGGITLLGTVEAVAVLLVVSVPIGLLAGYLGGWLDRSVSAVVDLMLSMPAIIIILAVLAVFGHNMSAAMITFGLLGSAGLIRVVRSAVIAIREELYLAAARVAGCSEWQILLRHVLPRVAGPVIVQTSLFAGAALAIQTGLAFLNLGVVPPAPSWGAMVGEAAQNIEQDPWLMVPSGGIIAITILALGLLGDGIRDATVDGWSRRGAPRAGGKPVRARAVGRSGDARTDRDSSAAVLSVQGLTVEFALAGGATTVVQDVSFELAPGEILGIVGESGCGKTVTALSLLGLLPRNAHISNGRVLPAGRDITTLNAREMTALRGNEIAMIFQEPMVSLDPCFRVGAQLAEMVRLHDHLPRQQVAKRVHELLAQVRLPNPEQVARRYPHQLSGGMAQRVCIALALAARPKMLLADEPTTALDVTVQAEILDLLRTLRAETGLSIVLVTHDLGVVADVCDRAVVMYAGEVVECAPTNALFEQTRHPYTLGLIASDPQRSIDADELPTITGTVPPPGRWPTGCHFRDRCGLADDECAGAPIPLLRDRDREVRCVHWQALERAGAAR